MLLLDHAATPPSGFCEVKYLLLGCSCLRKYKKAYQNINSRLQAVVESGKF